LAQGRSSCSSRRLALGGLPSSTLGSAFCEGTACVVKMDQKKLREMMRLEKERRAGAAGTAGAAQRQVRGGRPAPRQATQVVVAVPQRAPPSTAARAPASVDPAKCTEASVPLVEARKEEDEPAAKRARADALAMPPPPVPPPGPKGRDPPGLSVPTSPVSAGVAKEIRPTGTQAPAVAPTAPEETEDSEDGPSAVSKSPVEVGQGANEEQSAGAIGGEALGRAATAPEDEEAEGATAIELPEGFFDDPDMDAKVRGVEAPAERAKRELEEGLKRFEREMHLELEQSEETRHELDEERHEQVAEEEQELQSELHGRLKELRKRRAATAARKTQQQQQQQGGGVEATTADASSDGSSLPVGDAAKATLEPLPDDGSGSDVEFDWRAKEFG